MARDVKLGLNTGYWTAGPPPGIAETVAQAEEVGFDSLWTAEAYGSDVLTPLAWWGASTTSLRLGTALVQMSARTPAATAMAAMTMDHLSGGRFILGIGVSGPQVVEGPKNVALAGELCDGWLALFFSPTHESFYRDALAEGFARARRSFDDFEV